MRIGKIFVAILVLAIGSSGQDRLRQRPRYTLTAGDMIELRYRYTPELDQTLTVSPDGYIDVQLIGEILVRDLTVQQAHDLIIRKAAEHLNSPEVTLSLEESQQPYVMVAGEVARPGKMDLRENTTAMQAILLAGGFAPTAHSDQVLLFRRINGQDAEVRVLRLSKLNKTADLEHDCQLEPGDMLLVPRNKIEKLSRYTRLANLGVFFNPLQNVP
jgi:polysaccharide export outer membrane protein